MTWLRGEKGVSIGVEEPTDYVAVSGKFLFTDKDCKEALNTDWSGPVDVFEAPFLNAPYTMLAFPPPEKVTHPVCMRTMSLKLRYKKPL